MKCDKSFDSACVRVFFFLSLNPATNRIICFAGSGQPSRGALVQIPGKKRIPFSRGIYFRGSSISDWPFHIVNVMYIQ